MHGTQRKIAVIVPAYNEEGQIGTVLDILKKVNLIEEIIVVNDGSKDKTSDVAKSYDVRVIDKEKNSGKGSAMQAGIDSTDADIIGFIDADLTGITPRHIEDLIKPILDDPELMMTVGIFTGGRLRTDLAQTIVPFISGQRVVRREFLKGLPDLNKTGYGVEVVITKHAKQNKFKIKEIPLPQASQVMKEEKFGVLDGFKARMKMYGDIAKQFVTEKNKPTKAP